MGRSACGNGPKFELSPLTLSDEVDPSAGCSYELIKIIADITDLSRTKSKLSRGDSSMEEWHEKRSALRHQLNDLVQRLPPSLDVESSDVLTQSASLIHLAARIYYSTSLMSQTDRVEGLVHQGILKLSKLRLRSQHLWPTFVIALFVVEDADRIVILDAFEKIQVESPILSAGSAARARHIVDLVWKRIDLSTNISYERVWDGIVRQMSEGLSLG